MECDERHSFCEVSLLDFSELEESKLFLSSSNAPHPHSEDEKYLQFIIRHRMHHEETSDKDRNWLAEKTDFPVSSELQKSFFKVLIRYRDKVLIFKKCRSYTLLTGLIVKSIACLEPMDLSCSWLESDPTDYILKVGSGKEYIFNHHIPISSLVYVRECFSRSEQIEFTLIEKSNFDSFISEESAKETVLFDIPKQTVLFSHKMRTEKCYDSHTIRVPLVLNLHKIEGVKLETVNAFTTYTSYEDICFSLEVSIDKFIDPVYISSLKYTNLNDDLKYSIPLPLFICDLPRETVIHFRLFAKRENPSFTQRFLQTWVFMESQNPILIGWNKCSIFDFQGCLRTKLMTLPLWSNSGFEDVNDFYIPSSPPENEDNIRITFSFSGSKISHPVLFSQQKSGGEEKDSNISKFRPRDWEKIQSGKASDTLLWKYRKIIRRKNPNLLIALLKTVNWDDKKHVADIHQILKDYPIIYPFAGFEILALETLDIQVREYAVKCLQSLSDKEMQECMPQLIQSLKTDTYISSALSIFIIMRALKSRSVGHTFYWYLISEMDDLLIRERFRILKQCYLENILSEDRRALLTMEKVISKLIWVADQAHHSRLSEEQIKSCLYEITFPETFLLPTNTKKEIQHLNVEECLILKSKTRPLWLTFEDIDGKKVYIILKVGDDIRVDVLALQMMKILDSFWKKEGLDLHLQPYVALPLAKKVGLIQVASKSETTSSINWKYGGNTFASAFSSTSLKAYLYKNNSPEEREQALRNFALSCAGYCVFTYVFGVGDRHGDNILCTKKGNVFHIDFGYFLGERSKFLGISRETNFFVLTPNYINAMDKFFSLFVTLSCQGYVIAQRYESTFTTLIQLMLPCGKDVISEEQINYVKTALEPWLSEKEGQRKFYRIIQCSLGDKRTLLNDFAHLLATKNRTKI